MKASYKVQCPIFANSDNEYTCCFYIDGRPNYDERGTEGMGCKWYSTKEKAEAAGKRYLKKMQNNGFEI